MCVTSMSHLAKVLTGLVLLCVNAALVKPLTLTLSVGAAQVPIWMGSEQHSLQLAIS